MLWCRWDWAAGDRWGMRRSKGSEARIKDLSLRIEVYVIVKSRVDGSNAPVADAAFGIKTDWDIDTGRRRQID